MIANYILQFYTVLNNQMTKQSICLNIAMRKDGCLSKSLDV